jgi:hypothetical protein
VVPYEGRVLPSMNTGSPHILHTRRWERFGRTINHLVDDLNGWNGDALRDAEAQVPGERRVKTNHKEML